MNIQYFEHPLGADFVIHDSAIARWLATGESKTDRFILTGLDPKRSTIIGALWHIVNTSRVFTTECAINAIEIIDHYTAYQPICEDQILVLVITALVLSSKYYDDLYVGLHFFRNVVDINHLVSSERVLLHALDWKVERISPYSYIANCNINRQVKYIAVYMLELISTVDIYARIDPRTIALFCIYTAHRTIVPTVVIPYVFEKMYRILFSNVRNKWIPRIYKLRA